MNADRLFPIFRHLHRACVAAGFALLAGTAAAQTLPILVISDASIVEGDSGSKILVLPVNFSGAQPGTVTGLVSATPLSGAGFKPATGGAVCGAAGVDFEQFSNVAFSIPPNTPNGTLSVNIRICGDITTEPNEHIFVALTNVVGAQCLEGTCNAVATILNDDAAPTLSINSLSTSEPALGTKTASFTVSLNRLSAFPVSVNYATRDGTARAGSDYVARSGTLQIPANTASGTIGITINADAVTERDETFFVDLSAPVNATVATGTGSATVRNTTLFTGGFDLSPGDARARLGEKLIYTLQWTVPPGEVWRDLRTIDLRWRGGHGTALWVRWDQASNRFSLCEHASNAGGRGDGAVPQQAAACGPGALPDSTEILAGAQALLHLADTSVVGSGPTGPSVTLTLGVTFVGKAGGHDYKVELAAGDDFGNEDVFERAGALSVWRPDHGATK